MTPLNFPSPSLFIFMCAELLFSEEEKNEEEKGPSSLFMPKRGGEGEKYPQDPNTLFPPGKYISRCLLFSCLPLSSCPPLKTPDPVLAIEDVDLAPFSKDPTRGKEFQEKIYEFVWGNDEKRF